MHLCTAEVQDLGCFAPLLDLKGGAKQIRSWTSAVAPSSPPPKPAAPLLHLQGKLKQLLHSCPELPHHGEIILSNLLHTWCAHKKKSGELDDQILKE